MHKITIRREIKSLGEWDFLPKKKSIFLGMWGGWPSHCIYECRYMKIVDVIYEFIWWMNVVMSSSSCSEKFDVETLVCFYYLFFMYLGIYLGICLFILYTFTKFYHLIISWKHRLISSITEFIFSPTTFSIMPHVSIQVQ